VAAKKELYALLKLEESEKPPTWWNMSDQFQCMEAHGIPYPKNFPPSMIALTHRLALIDYWRLVAHHSEGRQLNSGLLFNDVITCMENTIQKKDNIPIHIEEDGVSTLPAGLKMVVYVLHDSSLVGVLKILDLWDGEWPPFAAHFAFELVKDSTSSSSNNDPYPGWYVNVLVDKEVKRSLSFKDFHALVKPMLITSHKDYVLKCNKDGDPVILFNW